MKTKLAVRVIFFACLLATLLQGATRPAVGRALASLKGGVKHATIPGEFLARFEAEPGDLSSRGVKSAVSLGGGIYRLEFEQEITVAEAQSRLEGMVEKVEVNSIVLASPSPATSGSWVEVMNTALNVKPLMAALDGKNLQKVRFVSIDTGLACVVTPIGENFDWKLSKSFVDNSPCTDEGNHGTLVALRFLAAYPFPTDWVSLKIFWADGPGHFSVTLDGLISAISYLKTWDDQPTVVNMSIQGFPDSDLLKSAMASLKDKFLLAVAAGNNKSQEPNYPAYYASSLGNTISVAAVEADTHMLSSISDYGNWVNIAGFETATSFTTPQVGAMAAYLLSLRPGLPPVLLKKLILEGGIYEPSLGCTIGNTNGSPCGRTLNGGGTLNALLRLQSIVLTGYATDGINMSLLISESLNWLTQFSLQVQLTDTAGAKTLVPASVGTSGINFAAPKGDGYTAQLVIEGSAFGNQMTVK